MKVPILLMTGVLLIGAAIAAFFVWYLVPRQLEEPKVVDTPPAVFSQTPQSATVALMAAGSVNALYFYDNYEKVGQLTWDDRDGDGELSLSWSGMSVERSAKVLIDFLKESGRVCTCPE